MLPKLDDALHGQKGNLSLEDTLRTDLDSILQRQPNRQILNRERDLNIYRSGSAPPTVEGSLNAVGSLLTNSISSSGSGSGFVAGGGSNGSINGILSEDEIRSHPAYLSYYYSHENINPRLPPPLMSKEDWRVAQRFQGGGPSLGDIGDWRKKGMDGGDRSSLFSTQPGLSVQQAENDLLELRNAARRNLSRNTSGEWLERGSDGLIGLPAAGLGVRRKSFADILQEGLDRPASLSGHLSRPASRNSFGDIVGATGVSDACPVGLCNGAESLEVMHSAAASPGFVGVKSHNRIPSHSFASAVGSSLSRSTTPEAQLVGRSPGSGLPPVGSRVGPIEKKGAVGSNVQNDSELAEIAATLSGLSLSNIRHATEVSHVPSQRQLDQDNQCDFLYDRPNGHNQSLQQQLIAKSNAENLSFSTNYIDFTRENGIVPNLNAASINSSRQVNIPKRTSSPNLYSKMNSTGFGSLEGSVARHQNANMSSVDFATNLPGDYSVNQKLNSMVKHHLDPAGIEDAQNLNGLVNHVGLDFHSPVMDPRYMQYLQGTSDYPTRGAGGATDPYEVRDYFGTPLGDLDRLHKAQLEVLLAQQKQHELQLLGKSGGLNPGYYGTQSYRLGMPYSGNPFPNSVLPSVGSGSFSPERNSRFTSMMRSSMGGPTVWPLDAGNNMEGRLTSTLLDEFKTNKTRSFELSDIVDHVVEFSTDQYGSRFIQQKLEAATVEEKATIFPEIIPHARTLMTDVFGNYVIQKFFEHGTESQRAQLASQLTGHVLRLSLQMYGCRVIQKALEVVHVDQQTQMVAELDGSVMKCVHDQNGNHVIQKCIECVPQDRIQFIISAFYGQVLALSTHPYGCRVIQRVLEHCDDVNTQQIIMDEIMQHVCNLAQDQYGNYVIQHVLEHGKPHERSAIISELAGQIVRMSQQKFASNVVEKCLTFGSPEERQLLVNEMLGSTDENEPLQAMMKDPFGNYVVQKVLETCDDQSLELILSRIKVHLNVLKKYTYGKHIVSRIEKLIATGERRIGLSNPVTS
ncbi:putative Pumilio [Melia azedarach]|uniref:Pumilio n=1 Tax=Melia azedarach TaxID=155640 RepID=A0ACC1YBD6_MELAZ|nr:putative Pumilio [Melia azedarach]